MDEETLRMIVREELVKWMAGEGRRELGTLAAEAINEKRRALGETDLHL